jgi:hypothetical protein
VNALRSLQRELQSFVLCPSSSMEAEVVGTRRATAETRLRIYAEAYRLRLLEVLKLDFPTLRVWLGDEEFRSMALGYAEACPPTHFSVRYYGERLDSFLGTHASFQHRPFLAEMARFDWRLGEAFDAADGPTLDIETIAAIPALSWPRMRFQMHPSVRRTTLHWNVPSIRQAADQQAAAPALQPYAQAEEWVIWRRDLRTYFRSLPATECWALDAVLAGHCFAEICEGLCAWLAEDRVAIHAAMLLRGWTTEGMVGAVSLEEPAAPDV